MMVTRGHGEEMMVVKDGNNNKRYLSLDFMSDPMVISISDEIASNF